MKRLEDYLDNKEKKCKDVYRVHVTDKTTLDLCGDVMKVSKSCRLVIIRWVISCWGKKKVHLNIAHVYKSSYLFVSWVGLFLVLFLWTAKIYLRILDISLLLKETRIIHILNCLSVIIHVNLFSTWVLRTVVLALQRQDLSQTCLIFNQISFISLFGIDSLKSYCCMLSFQGSEIPCHRPVPGSSRMWRVRDTRLGVGDGGGCHSIPD